MWKIKIIFFISAITLAFTGNCQINLVPNSSFEDTLNCPGFQVYNTSHPWYTPNFVTPDYFYGTSPSCGNSASNNPAGFQLPRTGIAYVGLFLSQGNTREYIQTQLTVPLVGGTKYVVKFYISRSHFYGNATDAVGAHISANPIYDSGWMALPFVPQILNPAGNVLIDTMNWLEISGIYIAVGGEEYLTIGNFNDTSNTTLVLVDNSAGNIYNAYYYVDDVSITIYDSIQSLSDDLKYNQLNLYPNPCSEKYMTIEIKNFVPFLTLEVYNSLGQKLLTQNIEGKVSIINIDNFAAGMYLVKCQNKGNFLSKLFIKQ